MSKKQEYNIIGKELIKLPDFDTPEGWILDFGGGGEGIIGQLKRSMVIAIDRRSSELDEAIEAGSKALHIVMDGTDLKFLDNTFSAATAFFSLMYVTDLDDFEKIFQEIFRVLKKDTLFHIWDLKFSNANPEEYKISVIEMEIALPSGKKINTGYGTRKLAQKYEDFIHVAEMVGFSIESSEKFGNYFYLTLKK